MCCSGYSINLTTAHVDEVIASDKNIRIVSTGTPQHYLVADSKGNAATIEFLSGTMVAHKGTDLPFSVLANSTYSSSIKAYSNKNSGNNSIERFSTACSMVQRYEQTTVNKPLVDYSFDILDKVSQPGLTKWSIVYDMTEKKIYFKTSDNSAQRFLSISDFSYKCSGMSSTYNISEDDKGIINKKFTGYSNDANKKIMKQAFRESSDLNIPEALQNLASQLSFNSEVRVVIRFQNSHPISFL